MAGTRLISLKRAALDFTHILARLPFLVINLQADTTGDDMDTSLTTEELMDDLLAMANQQVMSMREQYLLRETLYSLARLARSERMVEIRQSVQKALPAGLRQSQRRGKGRRQGSASQLRQGQLAFGRHD